MKIGDQQITGREDVEKYLSKSLTAETKGLKGSAYLGKIFSNLGNMAMTKLHRIQTLFAEGKWMKNDKIMNLLLKDVKDLGVKLQSREVTGDQIQLIRGGIDEMTSVCEILQKSGADEKKLAQVIHGLISLIDTAKEANQFIGNKETAGLNAKHITSLEIELKKREDKVRTAEQKFKNAEEQIILLNSQITNVDRELNQLKHDKNQEKINQAQNVLQEKENEVTAAKKQIEQLQETIASLESKLKSTGTNHEIVNQRADELQQQLTAAQLQLQEVEGKYDKAQQDLSQDRALLEDAKKKLETIYNLGIKQTANSYINAPPKGKDWELSKEEQKQKDISDAQQREKELKEQKDREIRKSKEANQRHLRDISEKLRGKVSFVIEDAYQFKGFEQSLGKHSVLRRLIFQPISADNKRLQELKNSKNYELKASNSSEAVGKLLKEVTEVRDIIVRGFTQEGGQVPEPIQSQLDEIIQFAENLKNPTNIERSVKTSLKSYKKELGFHIGELMEIVKQNSKFSELNTQNLGVFGRSLIPEDNERLEEFVNLQYEKLPTLEIKEVLSDIESFIKQGFNQNVPNKIKKLISEIKKDFNEILELEAKNREIEGEKLLVQKYIAPKRKTIIIPKEFKVPNDKMLPIRYQLQESIKQIVRLAQAEKQSGKWTSNKELETLLNTYLKEKDFEKTVNNSDRIFELVENGLIDAGKASYVKSGELVFNEGNGVLAQAYNEAINSYDKFLRTEEAIAQELREVPVKVDEEVVKTIIGLNEALHKLVNLAGRGKLARGIDKKRELNTLLNTKVDPENSVAAYFRSHQIFDFVEAQLIQENQAKKAVKEDGAEEDYIVVKDELLDLKNAYEEALVLHQKLRDLIYNE